MALHAKISYCVLKSLEESSLRFLNLNPTFFEILNKYYLGVEMFSTSFTFKAPNVIVCEITEIRIGET